MLRKTFRWEDKEGESRPGSAWPAVSGLNTMSSEGGFTDPSNLLRAVVAGVGRGRFSCEGGEEVDARD